MKLVRMGFLIALGLTLVCLAGAFLSLGGWSVIGFGLFLGLLWGILAWKGLPTYSLGFFGLLAILVWASFSRLPAGWLLGFMIALLASWDLEQFMSHLSAFDPAQTNPVIIHQHLVRLLAVSAIGLLLGGAALVVQVQLAFGFALLLGILVILALAGMVRYLRRSL